MIRFSTVDLSPPAAITFFTPPMTAFSTNVQLRTSLAGERIHSAFLGAQRELERYERYAPGWDGYGAEPFAADVLKTAGQILAFSEDVFVTAGQAPTLVTTGPASDGSVDLEMQVGDRRVLITLYPQEDKMRLSRFDSHGAYEDVASIRTKTLEDWLAWLHRSRPLPAHVDHNPGNP